MKLIERKIENRENHGIWFDAESDSGKKYSIVNIGKLMETDSSYTREQWESMWANTWESAELKDGRIDVETIIQAESWEELEKLLV